MITFARHIHQANLFQQVHRYNLKAWQPVALRWHHFHLPPLLDSLQAVFVLHGCGRSIPSVSIFPAPAFPICPAISNSGVSCCSNHHFGHTKVFHIVCGQDMLLCFCMRASSFSEASVCLLLSETSEQLRTNTASSDKFTGSTPQRTSKGTDEAPIACSRVFTLMHVRSCSHVLLWLSSCLLYSSCPVLLVLALCSKFQICSYRLFPNTNANCVSILWLFSYLLLIFGCAVFILSSSCRPISDFWSTLALGAAFPVLAEAQRPRTFFWTLC